MSQDPILDMYIFETNQLIEQLEGILLESEEDGDMSVESVNEVFRIMHTIKGSSAMMTFKEISSVSHRIEDLFFYIREGGRSKVDFAKVCDLVLLALDFIVAEVEKIESEQEVDGDGSDISNKINAYLQTVKREEIDETEESTEAEESKEAEESTECEMMECKEDVVSKECHGYMADIKFQEGCEMENIRAFTILGNIKIHCKKLYHEPDELLDNGEEASKIIAQSGFKLHFTTDLSYERVKEIIEGSLFVEKFSLESTDREVVEEKEEELTPRHNLKRDKEEEQRKKAKATEGKRTQSIINVNTEKLDKLLDLVGEIVITETMVIKNPDLSGLELENFQKSARQLKKLTDELQDVAMALRMIPIGPTFQKMHRIVRDMSKKIEKDVELVVVGEDTEVDKNVIDHLGDPMMHLIRNAMDHGIESGEEREYFGKSQKGKIYLEALNTGGDIIIKIADDGKGLDRDVLIEKAREKNLISKPDTEISDKEAYSLILLPGFSTKEAVTEFSGRGVGMDVVRKNIEKIGGSIAIDSAKGKGTSLTIKIPLTLAIIDGMQVSTGSSMYTIPISAIRESFRPVRKDIVRDTDGNEMIMIRGECHPVIRIHEHFNLDPITENLTEGIIVVVEGGDKTACLFVDELLGEQQVVIKPLPSYLNKYRLKEHGIGGCNILGDGRISLIVNVEELINMNV